MLPQPASTTSGLAIPGFDPTDLAYFVATMYRSVPRIRATLARSFSRGTTIRPLKSTYPPKFWTSIRTLEKRLKEVPPYIGPRNEAGVGCCVTRFVAIVARPDGLSEAPPAAAAGQDLPHIPCL